MSPFSHVPSADPLPILLILLLGCKSPAVFEYKSGDRSLSPIVIALIPIPIILNFPYHLNRCPNNFFSHKMQWPMECPSKRGEWEVWSGYLFPGFPLQGPSLSECLSSCQGSLSAFNARNCNLCCPFRSGVGMEPHQY